MEGIVTAGGSETTGDVKEMEPNSPQERHGSLPTGGMSSLYQFRLIVALKMVVGPFRERFSTS